MFSSLISSNIYQALSKWALTSKEKNIIIDPLSCFIKIGLLNFYQEGTKISITNNQIKFDEPNYFQDCLQLHWYTLPHYMHQILQNCLHIGE